MAMSPGSRRRDTPNTPAGDPPRDQAPLGAAQDPLGPAGRPVTRTSDDNDVNIGDTGTRRTTAGLSTAEPRAGRGFTTTFAIIAAVLLAAFLVALYFGAEGTYFATAPTDTAPPIAEVPATPGDATGSTSPPQPQETVPPTGGTTAPANP